MEDKEPSNIVVELTEAQTNTLKNADACSLILKPFIPPQSKIQKIDMTACIVSGIDCEFSDRGNAYLISQLGGIEGSDFITLQSAAFTMCRVRENYWHPWLSGGSCPLPDGLVVDLLLRNGEVSNNHQTPTNNINHTWHYITSNDGVDIIAFRVIGIADGWEY